MRISTAGNVGIEESSFPGISPVIWAENIKIRNMTKVALITGITGQDGAYLADFLLGKNYKVYGTYRRLSTPNFWRLQYLAIFEKVNLIPADLIDAASVFEAINTSQPDEI